MELPLTNTYFFEPKKIEIIHSKNYLPACLLISFAAHILLVSFFISPSKKNSLETKEITKNNASIIFQITHPTVSIAKSLPSTPKEIVPTKVIPKTINKAQPVKKTILTETAKVTTPAQLVTNSESAPTPTSSENGSGEITSGGIGQISTQAKTNYESVLANWLERYRAYPSRALRRRITGAGVLYVKINQLGKVLEYNLEKSTNQPMLDEAIIAMLKKAAPLPKIPADFNLAFYEFAVPIDFKIE